MIQLASSNSEPPKPRIVVVILNWNGRDDTLECLESVEKIDYPNFGVIVVDNGSCDDSVAAIHAAFPRVEVIETGANLGFSGGNNAGIKRALELGADYVLLLNNDTEVDERLLRAFVSAAERFPNAAAFSAKIYFFHDRYRIWHAGTRWDSDTCRFVHIGEGLQDDHDGDVIACETDYACGCAFFVAAARLQKIGLLDDAFFLYFEETDWCYRARRAGYASVFVPEAKLWHKVAVSFGGDGSPLAIYFVTRNRLLWAARHARFWSRPRIYANAIRSLMQQFLVPLFGTLTRAPLTTKGWWWSARDIFRDPGNRAQFLGVRDFFLGRVGNCPDEVRELAKEWSANRAAGPQFAPGPQIRRVDSR